MTNLLANAIKFTPAGGVVRICLARRCAHAQITVSDSGRGISAKFLPHIFEPFGQAVGDKATAVDGLGLGLTDARHHRESQGKINAEGPGQRKGTKLLVTLPLLDETASDKPTR
jgi:signal transduction histidine kinase